jgi:hypothetical protein
MIMSGTDVQMEDAQQNKRLKLQMWEHIIAEYKIHGFIISSAQSTTQPTTQPVYDEDGKLTALETQYSWGSFVAFQ